MKMKWTEQKVKWKKKWNEIFKQSKKWNEKKNEMKKKWNEKKIKWKNILKRKKKTP